MSRNCAFPSRPLPLGRRRLILLRLPRLPHCRAIPHNEQEDRGKGHEEQGEECVRPTIPNLIAEWQQDRRENSTNFAPHQVVGCSSRRWLAGIDINHENVQDLEGGCKRPAHDEDGDNVSGQMELDGQEPAPHDEKEAGDEEQWESDFEPSFLDWKVGKVLRAIVDNG